MTERFKYIRTDYRLYIQDTEKDGEWKKGYRGTYGEFDLDKITIELNKRENKINHLKNENEKLKSENIAFKKALQEKHIFYVDYKGKKYHTQIIGVEF